MTGAMRGDDPRHGTENGYGNLGCRCDECTAAHAAYCWRMGYKSRPAHRALYRDRYRLARAAGYSSYEAAKRAKRSDPLA